MKFNKGIFFDRDGTLIDIPKYTGFKPQSFKKLNQVHIKKDVIEACTILKKKYLLFLITNQPDVSRGLNSKINVENINSYLQRKLFLDEVMVSYSDDDKDYFRKPNPGMIIGIKQKYKLDLTKSFVVGDRWRDIDAGYKANCKTILIDNNYKEKINKKPDFTVKKFKQILKYINI
jgi:D-glycero-D-manno-heptose 1,7-bisphosphate phosphatase